MYIYISKSCDLQKCCLEIGFIFVVPLDDTSSAETVHPAFKRSIKQE